MTVSFNNFKANVWQISAGCFFVCSFFQHRNKRNMHWILKHRTWTTWCLSSRCWWFLIDWSDLSKSDTEELIHEINRKTDKSPGALILFASVEMECFHPHNVSVYVKRRMDPVEELSSHLALNVFSWSYYVKQKKYSRGWNNIIWLDGRVSTALRGSCQCYAETKRFVAEVDQTFTLKKLPFFSPFREVKNYCASATAVFFSMSMSVG